MPTAAPAKQRTGVILAALMMAMVLASLDSTIVSTALPTIVGDLGGLDHLSWVVTAYLLASTVSTPLYGKLGDQFGRKKFFLAAIVIFLVGSAACGVAQTLNQLIAFRALQGLGGGGLMVGAQAVMADILSPRERGRYSGYFGAVFGVTSVAGPLIGGFFVDNASWRWVFYVNLPLGVLALLVISTVLKASEARVSHRIDYAGSALLTAGVTCVVLLTTWGGTTYGWGSPTIIAMGVAAVVALVLFVGAESRAEEPVIPLALFRQRNFSVCSVIGFVMGFALFGVITYLPQFQQVVRGASATASGLQLFPLMGGLLLASIGSGQLISRTGHYKVFPVAGGVFLTAGVYLLSRLGVHTGTGLVAVYMAVTGIGLGLTMQVLVLVVQNSVSSANIGTATSAATFFRSIGGSIGVAIFGAIFNNRMTGNLAHALPQLAGNPTLAGQLRASPDALAKLPATVRGGYQTAFTESLHVVFLAAIPFAAVAFLLTLLIREVPLRTSIGVTDGFSESFGMLRAAAVQVQEEGHARLAAARVTFARLPELALSPHLAAQVGGVFGARVAYLEAIAREAPEPGSVGADAWTLATEALRAERLILAEPGDEVGVRLRAAQAALDRISGATDPAVVQALSPLREAYESRIERMQARTVSDDSPFWQATLTLLTHEREALAAWSAEHALDQSVAERASRDLADETLSLAMGEPV